jgi:hypothetical protein
MKLKISIPLLFLIFLTNLRAQISKVKFTENQIAICYKTNDTKVLTAKILTSLNSPAATTCQNGSVSACVGNINADVVANPITNLNTQSFGPIPYYVKSVGRRVQYLIKAQDINPTGNGYYSKIKSLSFRITSMNLVLQNTIPNFKIKLKCTTTLNALTGNFEPTVGPPSNPTNGFTTVFSGTVTLPPLSPMPVWLKHNFTIPNGYGWDGLTNIIVDICFDGISPSNVSPLNPIHVLHIFRI